MQRYEAPAALLMPHGPTIQIASQESVGRILTAGGYGTSAGWPANNRALFFPIDLVEAFLVAEAFAVFGASPVGNVDFGLYDAAGNRLASTGSTAVTATTDLQAAALAYNLLPGQDAVYFAMACSSTATLVYRANGFTAVHLTGLGCREMAAAFPLPDPVTFADISSAYLPAAGISKRTLL